MWRVDEGRRGGTKSAHGTIAALAPTPLSLFLSLSVRRSVTIPRTLFQIHQSYCINPFILFGIVTGVL